MDHAGNKGIGDIVCELNYYRALRQRYPTASLISRGSRTLAWGNPLIDGFDEHSPDEAFDLVIRQPSLRAIAEDLPQALKREETIFDIFLRHQGFEPLHGPPALHVLPRELAALDINLDLGERLIIAYSADSKEPDRRWGQERFQALARHLESVHGAFMIELGSGLTEGHLGVGLDLVGKTDLRQGMAILAAADLFVGNNGGLTHLAGGVGTPILVPWGANSPYEAYVYDELSVAVGTAPPCRNCGWTGVFRPACLEVDQTLGRTPCTQDIAIADMIEAADELIPLIRQERQSLRQQKQAHMLAARDPLSLERFESEGGVTPYGHLRLSMGGDPGWAEAPRIEWLRRVVAFPDWADEGDWKQLIAAYAAMAEAASPWVLVLSASPLTGPKVRTLLETFVYRELRPRKPIPKIQVLIGTLSEAERRALVAQADVFIPTTPGETYVELLRSIRAN